MALPTKADDGEWIFKSYVDGARLINYNNHTRIISISGWTKEDGLVVLETELLKEANITAANVVVPQPADSHVAIETLYGVWMRCGPNVSLIPWSSNYQCLGLNYSTPNALPQISLVRESDPGSLLSHTDWRRSQSNFGLRNLIENQDKEIENRSKLVDEYISQLKSFVELTKQSTNFLTGIVDSVFKLLPSSWGDTIKRVLLIGGLIIAAPILFVGLIIFMKCLSFVIWCYKPIVYGAARLTRTAFRALPTAILATGRGLRRLRLWRSTRDSDIVESVVRYRNLSREQVELPARRHHGRAAKNASKVL